MEQPRHRFYAPDLSGEVVDLDAAQAHHAGGVLRLRKGQAVDLFDGAGQVAGGIVQELGRRRLTVAVTQRQRLARPGPAVELAFAVPKGKRLDWLLEKATELGAARLCPVVFERSVATPELTGHAQARWMATCIAAAKQCRIAFLPEIAAPLELGRYLEQCSAACRLMGDPDATGTVAQALAAWSSASSETGVLAVLTGPEGGITEAEAAVAAKAGFTPVRLGKNILRVETAPIALLAAVQAICG